jgi:hypothetical protein
MGETGSPRSSVWKLHAYLLSNKINKISEKGFYLKFFGDTPYAIQMSDRKSGALAIIQCMWICGLFNDAISISDLGMPAIIRFTVHFIPLCCWWIQDLTIENYNFPTVLYGCESCSLSLRRTFENRVLREIFRPTRQEEEENWIKLHNEKFHDFKSLSSMTKSRRIKWEGRVALGERKEILKAYGREKWVKNTAWKTQAYIGR